HAKTVAIGIQGNALVKTEQYIPFDIASFGGGADFHSDYKTDLSVAYSASLLAIQKCAQWEVQTNQQGRKPDDSKSANDEIGCDPGGDAELKKQIYGHPCNINTGQFDQSKCVFARCRDGYYRKINVKQGTSEIESEKCEQIPKNPYSPKKGLSVFVIILIVVAVVIFLIIMAFVIGFIVYFCLKKKKEEEKDKQMELEMKEKNK
ncbi:MAG: hypothetical protein EZS28_023584, partial [Streblomastix strix]